MFIREWRRGIRKLDQDINLDPVTTVLRSFVMNGDEK